MKRNSFASLLYATFSVTIGLSCSSSLSAFAAEDSGQTNPASVSNPPSPPPPAMSAANAVSSGTAPANPIAFDPSMHLTPEEGREYWDRYVTGDWWGLRTLLHNWGIDFNLDYFSETASNVSGGKDTFSGFAKNSGQVWAYTDQALFGVDLDFNKLIGWEGGSFEFYVTKRTGNNLGNLQNPNTVQLIQEVWGRGQTWRITSMWFKQTLLNDTFEIKAGLMNMSQEFGGYYAFPFENLTFTAGITGNVAGYSMFTWPVSQWGTDFQWNATKDLSFRIGLFAFNNYWISNQYYLRVDNPGGTTGAIVPFEIDWKPKLNIFGQKLPGEWVLGAFGNTNHTETTGAFKSVLNGAPGAARFLGSTFTGDWGVYGSIWQQITTVPESEPEGPSDGKEMQGKQMANGAVQRPTKRGLSAFFGTIWLDPRTSFQEGQIFTGLYYWGPWSKRPYDSVGIATGWNRISGSVRNAERAYINSHPGSGFDVQNNEFVEEIFYSFDVFHGANIQPDLQWIINPGGIHNATNEVVLGIQLSVPL